MIEPVEIFNKSWLCTHTMFALFYLKLIYYVLYMFPGHYQQNEKKKNFFDWNKNWFVLWWIYIIIKVYMTENMMKILILYLFNKNYYQLLNFFFCRFRGLSHIIQVELAVILYLIRL